MSEDFEKAEVFNKFFGSVLTKEDMHSIPDVVNAGVKNQLRDLDFTKDDVLKILSGLRSNKSPGPDKIHPCVLRECAASLALPIYLLFRRSMDEGHLPQIWKDGHITPIHKKGSRLQVGNYRPLSLTLVICKSFEKLIRAALLKHLTDNDLLSDVQHGFVPRRSCTTQLLQILDKWTDIINQGGVIDVIYLDFVKAFDSVPHHRLITKGVRFSPTSSFNYEITIVRNNEITIVRNRWANIELDQVFFEHKETKSCTGRRHVRMDFCNQRNTPGLGLGACPVRLFY